MLKHRDLVRKASLLALLTTLIFLATTALPVQAAQEISQVTGYVSVNQLNIRSYPGTSYNVVTVVYRSQALTLTGRTGDSVWLRVNTGNYSGWTYASYVYSDWPISNLPIVDDGPLPPPTPVGYVGIPYLNLRAGPGYNYPIIGGLECNTEVRLIGRSAVGSWLQISGEPGPAWVYAQYIWTSYPLNNLPITEEPAPPPQPTAWVSTYQLNFRAGPGLTFPIITVQGRGAQVTLLGRNNDGSWLMVDLGNGQVAWAMRRFLRTNYPIMNLPLIMTEM